MTPLRVALIGCGFIGRRHLENIAARTDVLLEATVDVREEAARAFCHGPTEPVSTLPRPCKPLNRA